MKHTRKLINSRLFALLFGITLVAACKTEEKLPDLGNQLAGPIDMVTSPSGNYIYVLNSDYERRFNTGSILLIDPNAADGQEKIAAFEVRRMGRSMHIAQNRLLVTYADSISQDYGYVELYDLTDETKPALLAKREITCMPINGVIAPSQAYFAVSCAEGDLWIGKGLSDDASITLDRARSYGYDRRALYFYEGAKTWLLAFPSDFELEDSADAVLEDKQKYDAATDAMVDGSNGVPDAHENTPQVRRRPQSAWPLQVAIYPLSDEETASAEPQSADTPPYATFRFLPLGIYTEPTSANSELRYIRYSLTNSAGVPTGSEGTLDPNVHSYHTNFWEAKASLSGDPAEFYVSQRGDYGAQANNVLRMYINESGLASTSSTFEQTFTVERAYGQDIDRDNGGRYPCDFELAIIGGEPMLLINHFRDLIYFAGAPFYAITRKFLDGSKAQFEQPSSKDSTRFEDSYYQLAVSGTGKVLTASFYGNVLYLFDANPSISIKDQTPIRIE